MRRYGKFTDMRWIQHRMNMKDARFARAQARHAVPAAALVDQLRASLPTATEVALVQQMEARAAKKDGDQ
jgi:hypothetical protein